MRRSDDASVAFNKAATCLIREQQLRDPGQGERVSNAQYQRKSGGKCQRGADGGFKFGKHDISLCKQEAGNRQIDQFNPDKGRNQPAQPIDGEVAGQQRASGHGLITHAAQCQRHQKRNDYRVENNGGQYRALRRCKAHDVQNAEPRIKDDKYRRDDGKIFCHVIGHRKGRQCAARHQQLFAQTDDFDEFGGVTVEVDHIARFACKERDRLRAALLSSIGHDLRTPLTGVTSAIEAIQIEHPDAATLPLARTELAKLRRFVDNLVDMVRLDADALKLALEPIDLTDAAATAIHDLKETLKGYHIDFQVPPSLPLVRADARLLHHILINLLANAVQHGGSAGAITLAGRRQPDAVLLSVRDQGPGFEPGMEDNIFETFAQGSGGDRHGGSGLGLAIVKGFAEAMGLGVTAANHPDGGAIFTLYFGPSTIVTE